ncbi:potassium channel, sub T, member 2 [Actinomortierella wolfii]|nr:potassium channel, sub T, member 2 [Actinomortierella wolfii]
MEPSFPSSYSSVESPRRVPSQRQRRRTTLPSITFAPGRTSSDERSWLLGNRASSSFTSDIAFPLRLASPVGSNSQNQPVAAFGRRATIKAPPNVKIAEVPGQTKDPLDPLNRAASIGRAEIKRYDSIASIQSTSTLPRSGQHHPHPSISARRLELQRQNSYGRPPNRFIEAMYDLKELTTSTDSFEEKTLSTLLNVFNVFVDLVFCILYLVEANDFHRPAGKEDDIRYIERSWSLYLVLVSIACYNLFNVLCSVLFAEAKWVAIRSTRHIITTLVAVPFIVSLFLPDGHLRYVPYFLQSIALVSRVQQALNFYIDMGLSELPMDPLKSKVITFAMYIVTMIYCAVSAFQVAEYEQLVESGDNDYLLKLLYFVLISISTIGYGDVTPKSQLGYATVILLILAVLGVFPWMISGIVDAVASAKAGEGIFKSGGSKFMIISGSVHSAQKLANVLNGFWFTNKEYSHASFKIVILGMSEPSKEIQALLSSARYKNRVVYLKGTPLDSRDLERIQAKNAEGIFIIADRNSSFTPQEEDRHNTLSALAFRNVSNAGIYTYNLLPETEILQRNAATQVVCADEIRQVLLGFNCLQQATATLILNLLHQHKPTDNFTEFWESEYDDSLGNELYTSYLNPIFDGKSFGFVSWFLYRRFQVTLFGVRIKLRSGAYHTALNPGKDYKFQHNEQCIFIAQSPSDVDEITDLTEKDLHHFLDHLQQTYEEDVRTVGPDYHAKNFSKAIKALGSKCNLQSSVSAGSTIGAASSIKGGTLGTGEFTLPYTRRSGRHQLHPTIPVAEITNDNEIDVTPEVTLIEEPQQADEDTEASSQAGGSQTMLAHSESHPRSDANDTNPISPPTVEPPSPTTAFYSGIRPSPRLQYIDRLRRMKGDPDFELRIGHPPAPFPGAKVPLCILIDSKRSKKERNESDVLISKWSEVLERRSRLRESLMTSAITEDGTLQEDGTHGQDYDLGHSSAQPQSTQKEPNHIVICSPNYDIFRLICTLRAAHLQQLMDVVILCPKSPTDHEFNMLRSFPRLYVIIGDCLSRIDLERAAIASSSKYLFLRHPDNGGVDSDFFDGKAVMNRILVQQIFADVQFSRHKKLFQDQPSGQNSRWAHRSRMQLKDQIANMGYDTPTVVPLKEGWDGPQCVYELVEERAVDLLQIRRPQVSELHQVGGGVDPAYAQAWMMNQYPSMLHQSNFSGQGFGYGADSLKLAAASAPQSSSSIFSSRIQLGSKKQHDFFHNPIYASGGVLVGGLLDHVLYQTYSNPSILEIDSGCYLECVPIPEGFGVKTSQISETPDIHISGGSSGDDDDDSSSSDSDMYSDDVDSLLKKQRDNKGGSRFQEFLFGSHSRKSGDASGSGSVKGKGSSNTGPGATNGSHQHHDHSGNTSSKSSSLAPDYLYDNRHKNFLHLYEHLALDQGVIPLGLLRLQGDDPNKVHLGIGGSSRCYAIVNPLLDTVVLDSDMVWVMRRVPNDFKGY